MEFEAVCRRWSEGRNEFFGTRVLQDLRDVIARPGAGSGAGPVLESSQARGRLGWELIRLGRHEDAIETLEETLGRIGHAKEAEEAEEAEAGDEGPGLPGGGDPAARLRKQVLRGLGLAHLQLAEALNCIDGHSARSCILPVRPEAVHRQPEHARRAGDYFLEILQAEPGNLQARWLLNLARMLTADFPDGVPAEHRWQGAPSSPVGEQPEWIDVGMELGVSPLDLAGGAAIEDFDGDGLLDIVTSTWDPCGSMKAFRNDGGGGFDDVSDEWGVSDQLGGLNLTHADFDNDGRPDVLVLRGAWMGAEGRVRNSLLRNEIGRDSGGFRDVTAEAGTAYPAYPTQTAAWADFDLDGDLDLYAGNEATASATNPLQLVGRTGNPYPSQLFRNNGDGTFTDVARSAGVANRRFAKGVAWGDYDDDGDPDLYVSNIGANRLYRNNGDGSFADVGAELGVTGPSESSFPTWFFDFDNDGDLDLFVADYSSKVEAIAAAYLGDGDGDGDGNAAGRPFLYRNDGGRFSEIGAEVGFARPHLVMGANYGDLDNDGWLDLYLGTGVPDMDALMPNVMYRNRNGETFEDVTFSGGFGHLQKGHGIAFGDLDNDGEQEIYQQLGGAYPFDAYTNALYENPGNDNHWITLRLRGRQANRFGVGARIEVVASAPGEAGDEPRARRSVHRVAGTGGSFGSSSLRQEIGLGSADEIESITIVWPGSGLRQVFGPTAVDRNYLAIEGVETLALLDLPPIDFAGASDSTEATHAHQ